jgi:predicted MPP superfamily phosphohydrolase
MSDSESSDMEALKERLGESAFIQRQIREVHLHEKEGDGRLLGGIEHKVDLYSILRKCLKFSGLWKRAVRNYLDTKLETNRVGIVDLPEAFNGFRILHLTDLHADLHDDFIEAVKQVIEPIEYDLLVITGDFRSATFGDHTGATSAVIELSRSFKADCYAVLGNHDSIEKVPRLEAVGIRFLLNEHVLLKRGNACLALVGIDDPNYYQTHNFEQAMAGIPEDCVKVLLSHSPETYKQAAQLGFDLQLSGHTHGGQICLPGGRVLIHDGTSPRRLFKGPWREGKLQGYTSRGTGGTGLPVRLNCPAEVTLHTLVVS